MKFLSKDICEKLFELENSFNEYVVDPCAFDCRNNFIRDSKLPSLTLWSLREKFVNYINYHYPIRNIDNSIIEQNRQIHELLDAENFEIYPSDDIDVSINTMDKFIQNIKSKCLAKVF